MSLEIFNRLGFGTPFFYAAAMYLLCMYFDKRASGVGKKALSDWMKSHKYDRANVANAVVELFDRLYGKHLFSFESVGRVLVYSIVIQFIFLLELARLSFDLVTDARYVPSLVIAFWVNLVSDYVSLFVVRYC